VKAADRCAHRHIIGIGETKAKRVLPGYSAFVNLLDYPAAVLPVMLADKKIDVVDEGYKPLNFQDEKCYLACKISILCPSRRR
jgi:hypothetical protein